MQDIERLNERHEFERPVAVEATQKPTMRFGNYECGCRKALAAGKEAREPFLDRGDKSAPPPGFSKAYRLDNPKLASWADPSTLHAIEQEKPALARVHFAATG